MRFDISFIVPCYNCEKQIISNINKLVNIIKNQNLNYKINMNANSFIPLAKDPKAFTSRFNSKMDKEFFITYCEQMKQKPGWKINFFNIKLN